MSLSFTRRLRFCGRDTSRISWLWLPDRWRGCPARGRGSGQRRLAVAEWVGPNAARKRHRLPTAQLRVALRRAKRASGWQAAQRRAPRVLPAVALVAVLRCGARAATL